MFPIFRSRHQTETRYHLLHVIYPNPVNGHKHLLPSHTLVQTSKVNSNKSPTRCNNFPVYYPDVYLQLIMFRAFSRPSSGAQWLQWQPLVLPSYRGDSRAVFVVGPARPRTQHGYHHNTKVKREAAAAVVELLTMGGRMPETYWAVNKRQDNKLENCCIWLVIYLNCMMNHGLANLKFV